ncbi:MAG: hypothetical protein JSW39_01335 [Desulfobacterales bacterium]|nr:MAG: hypothetical protein JSW39_01335 [Desulfobacterales bacterium]
MNLYGLISDGIRREVEADRLVGVAVGVVSNNQDPDGGARVKVTFPWLSEEEESHWARVASFMAGAERGAFFLPEVGDEVLVAFEQGDISRPYVIGALWNGHDTPPAANDGGENNLRLIKSRSGHLIKLDDTEGSEKIEIIDKGEENVITWDTSSNKITITAGQDIEVKAGSGKILLEATTIEIKASGEATIEASGTLTLKGATVNIN